MDPWRRRLYSRAVMVCLSVIFAMVSVGAAYAGFNQWSSTGPWGGNITTLVVTAPATIYAGTFDGGVFRSADGGTSWNAVNSGLGNATVYALAASKGVPTTIYAGTDDSGVFKSVDNGASWTATNNGLTVLSINALTVDPTNPSVVYAGTNGGGIFKCAT